MWSVSGKGGGGEARIETIPTTAKEGGRLYFFSPMEATFI
jgi:hypothetical protein